MEEWVEASRVPGGRDTAGSRVGGQCRHEVVAAGGDDVWWAPGQAEVMRRCEQDPWLFADLVERVGQALRPDDVHSQPSTMTGDSAREHRAEAEVRRVGHLTAADDL